MKMVDAKSQAQKIAFAPLTFQAVRAALNLGILKVLDDAGKTGISAGEIESRLGLPEYTVTTLLEVLESADIVDFKDGKYITAKIAQCFLYDKMTQINMDFVHDVCYQGAFYLQESFVKGKPEGLKVFGNWPTVYEGLSQLPEHVQKSWFAFDHFYSDNAFNDVIKIILAGSPKIIYDVGANTGKFEAALLSKNYTGKIVLCDLPQQLAAAKENLSAAGFKENLIFYPMDVLKKSGEWRVKSEDTTLKRQSGEWRVESEDTTLKRQSGELKVESEDTTLKRQSGELKVESEDTTLKRQSGELKEEGCYCSASQLPSFSTFDCEEDNSPLPLPDAILMSQFLDCFSKEEIISILKKAEAVMTEKSKLYILEPFWDNQKFEAAKFSLTHTSLYFTSIANGNSKMYSRAEMEDCAAKAGLKILKCHENVGSHEYTLLECGKDREEIIDNRE